MFPGIDGKIGLGELPDAEINANTGDMFSNLIMGIVMRGSDSG